MVQLRPAEASDRMAVADFWRLVFPGDPTHNVPEEIFDRKMVVQPGGFLLAIEAGQIVGTVMAGFDGHRGWIHHLAVHPDFRRTGLGRRLMESAEKVLAHAGCPKVNLQVRAENEEVISFYESIGYRIEDRISMGRRLES